MRTIEANGVRWFLDDEGLAPIVRELSEQRRARRTYRVIEWGENKLFAKYFLEEGIWGLLRNRIDPRGEREYRTGKKLDSFSIATPNPVGYGLGQSGSFVLQEWIEARPFRVAFQDGPTRRELLSSLGELLRKLRAAGINHNDLHLDNILVKGETLYLIDLHKAKIKRFPFLPFNDLVNVAHALGPIYRGMSEQEKVDFFRLYGKPEMRPILEKRLVEGEKRWVERKKARAFSTTSKLTRIGAKVYTKGAEGTGEGAFVECIKNDRKVRVERYSDHIRKIYRNNRRLKKAWRNHVAIEYFELPVVPKPKYVQRGNVFRSGFIAMEDLKGSGEELDRYLDRHFDTMEVHEARRFIDSLSLFFSVLYGKSILHRDLKACNLFVLEDGFRLLDVEDIVFRRHTGEDLQLMFCQLNMSVPGRISFSHRARFFLRISGRLGLKKREKKSVFADVVRASAGKTIVYEGVAGLRNESWTETPKWRHL